MMQKMKDKSRDMQNKEKIQIDRQERRKTCYDTE